MTTGGTLSFPDLTVPDPTYILPVVAAAATMGSARTLDVPTVEGGHAKNVATALTVLTVFIVPFLPSALCLYIAANGIFRMLQQFAIRAPSIRKMAGLPERKLNIEHTPSLRDTVAKYQKEFSDKWRDEKLRAQAFEAAQSRGKSGDILRDQFAHSPAVPTKGRKPAKSYKRPIVVYEDEVADVIRKEKEYLASQQNPAMMHEPERKRRGKRASA